MAKQGWTTRRAPHMEKYVVLQKEPTEEYPNGYSVKLIIGNQAFTLSNGVCCNFESLDQAKWIRDMLCIALDELVKQHKKDA